MKTLFTVLLAVVFGALPSMGAAPAFPRTVTVYPDTYQVAYPTNFWEINSNALNRAVAQQQVGGVTPADLRQATNQTIALMTGTNVVGRTLYVDGQKGSDVLAAAVAQSHLGSFLTPFKTISGALPYATNGDLIYIRPSIYAENQLAKNGVSYWLDHGAYISNYANDAVSGSEKSIFFDLNNQTNWNIYGNGGLIWHNGTNYGAFQGTTNVGAFHPNVVGSTNSIRGGYGCISTFDTNSTITIKLRSIEFYSYTPTTIGGFTFFGCLNFASKRFRIDVDEVIDRTYGTNANPMVWVRPDGNTNIMTQLGGGSCFYGEMARETTTWNVGHYFPTRFYAVWWAYPTNMGVINDNWYMNSDLVEGVVYTSGALEGTPGYTNSHTFGNLHRGWLKNGHVEPPADSTGIAGYSLIGGYQYILGGGKSTHKGVGGSGIGLSVGAAAGFGGTGDTTVYVGLQKATSSTYAVRNDGGILYGTIDEVEDTTAGQSTAGFYFGPGSQTFLGGSLIKGTNATLITHVGGTATLNGYTVSSVGGRQVPVTISTNGLLLQAMAVNSTPGTNTITATTTNAQSIELSGVALHGGAPSATVTVTPNDGYAVTVSSGTTNVLANVTASSLAVQSMRAGAMTVAVVDTNTIYTAGAGLAAANSGFTNSFAGTWVATTTTKFLTNNGGWWELWTGGARRYTNLIQGQITGTTWTNASGGTAPAPEVYALSTGVFRGPLYATNGGVYADTNSSVVMLASSGMTTPGTMTGTFGAFSNSVTIGGTNVLDLFNSAMTINIPVITNGVAVGTMYFTNGVLKKFQ